MGVQIGVVIAEDRSVGVIGRNDIRIVGDGRIGKGNGDAGSGDVGVGVVDCDLDIMMAGGHVRGCWKFENVAAAEGVDEAVEGNGEVLCGALEKKAAGHFREPIKGVLAAQHERIRIGEAEDGDGVLGGDGADDGGTEGASAVVSVGKGKENAAPGEFR